MPEGLEPDDHALAARLASEAGRVLIDLRARAGETPYDRWTLRDAGDLTAHEYLVHAISVARPADKVLSEEGVEDRTRLPAPRVWIVDPLDGTREFGELGRTDWAVHVALVIDETPVAGAVALPALGITLATGHDLPPLPPLDRIGRPIRVVVSRSRPPAAAVLAAEAVGGQLVPMGSAGAKAMAVVLGEAEVYAHAGGMYEWDSAAPVAVARAAGLHVSRIDGAPLAYNQSDPWLPDLLICRQELASSVISALVA